MTVSRATLTALAARHGLPETAADRFAALLTALAAEPAPPTTVADPAEAVDRHLADSLSGLEAPPLRQATRIADIGAGAGFPGLPLAIALPDAQVDLIESTGRKCDVIARLATAADIPNARAIPTRAEEWATTTDSYDVVTARALAALPVLAEYAAPLLTLGGHLVAWKTTPDPAEQQAGAQAATILGLEPKDPIPVRPFANSGQRSLHVYEKIAPTPPRYPRRPGIAAKRPLP